MENYRFIVNSEKLKEQIIAFLVEKKYKVDVDTSIEKSQLNCFVFWADGTSKCIIGHCDRGDNRLEITDDNIDWFLKQV